MDDPYFTDNVDMQVQEILLAASRHNITQLRALLRNSSADVKDEETGFTPLHAAIASCDPNDDSSLPTNGGTNGTCDTQEHAGGESAHASEGRQEVLDAAAQTVSSLFQHGAVWNEGDAEGETPGCMARRMGLTQIYELIVNQGVRKELLFTKIDQYDRLPDEDEPEEPTSNGTEPASEPPQVETSHSVVEDINESVGQAVQSFQSESPYEFFSEVGVMEAITQLTAEKLLPMPGMRLLSIEPSLEVLAKLQTRSPSMHAIIMRDASTVRHLSDVNENVIYQGDWKIRLTQLIEEGTLTTSGFDGVLFWDRRCSYQDFRTFTSEWAEQLLGSPPDSSRTSDARECMLSFFHGYGAFRHVEYDVYSKIIEMDLLEADFDIDWINVPFPPSQEAQQRRPWTPNAYKLPICRLLE